MLVRDLNAAGSALYMLCLICAAMDALLDDSDLAAPVRGVCELAAALGAARMIESILS